MVEGGTLATEVTGLHAFGRFVSATNTLLAFIGILEITGITHAKIHIVLAGGRRIIAKEMAGCSA